MAGVAEVGVREAGVYGFCSDIDAGSLPAPQAGQEPGSAAAVPPAVTVPACVVDASRPQTLGLKWTYAPLTCSASTSSAPADECHVTQLAPDLIALGFRIRTYNVYAGPADKPLPLVAQSGPVFTVPAWGWFSEPPWTARGLMEAKPTFLKIAYSIDREARTATVLAVTTRGEELTFSINLKEGVGDYEVHQPDGQGGKRPVYRRGFTYAPYWNDLTQVASPSYPAYSDALSSRGQVAFSETAQAPSFGYAIALKEPEGESKQAVIDYWTGDRTHPVRETLSLPAGASARVIDNMVEITYEKGEERFVLLARPFYVEKKSGALKHLGWDVRPIIAKPFEPTMPGHIPQVNKLEEAIRYYYWDGLEMKFPK